MKLSQILIEAGVTPDDLHLDCKFIAQDARNYFVDEYISFPKIILVTYSMDNSIMDSELYLGVNDLAHDWQTPLSREQFIADYDTHLTIQMNQDQWYSDLIR
jgi:hypothetical protein